MNATAVPLRTGAVAGTMLMSTDADASNPHNRIAFVNETNVDGHCFRCNQFPSTETINSNAQPAAANCFNGSETMDRELNLCSAST